MSRTILQRTITREEVATLLAEGRTHLLDGFISKRTNRPFKSYLVWDPKKKTVAFEFEKREKDAAKDAAKSAEAEEESAAAKKPVRRTAAKKSAAKPAARRTKKAEG